MQNAWKQNMESETDQWDLFTQDIYIYASVENYPPGSNRYIWKAVYHENQMSGFAETRGKAMAMAKEGLDLL
jgi:hypothetical protein